MRTRLSISAALLTALLAGCGEMSGKVAATGQAPLSTGRRIDPSHADASANIGSMPMNVVVSPDGKLALTTSSGSRNELCAIRIVDGKEVGKLNFRSNSLRPSNGLYYGLAFGPDKKLYAAMGAAGTVAVVTVAADGSLDKEKEIETGGKEDFAAGLALDASGRLYVAQNDPVREKGMPFGVPASVTVSDTASGKLLGRYKFPDDLGLSNFPLAVAVNEDGSRLYVGSQRDDAVYVLDASDPKSITLVAKVVTGSHPVSLLLDKKASRLFVANAHSDTVSIVDTKTNAVTGTILLRPQVAKDLAGATPMGLALSAEGKWLYAALGDMNAIAVIDVADAVPEVEAFLPTGWFPTAVAVSGKQLLVTNAKGDASRVVNPPKEGTKSHVSPLTLYEGTLWRFDIPAKGDWKALTEETLENARLTPKYLGQANPLKSISRSAGKIEHVIYIVKENRTYDQVLGDLPQGDGDITRCLFPRAITPNQHALAERFTLLDNFYDSGEVSGDGWTWSTQAHANEYTIRNVPYQYSGRGRVFDYEGTNNEYPTGGFPAKGPDGKPLSDDPRFANGAKPVPDVAASPGGHLWDLVRKQGLTYRNFGFFISNGVTEKGKVITPDNYPASTGVQPGGHDLDGITNVDFRRFDMAYPDSDAPAHYAKTLNDEKYLWPSKEFGHAKSQSRFSEWKREFDLMLKKDPTGASVPNLMTVRFCTDHTAGASSNKPSPKCMVADNDYAVGQLVEAISHSPIWKSTAIVIIEDDAQNGPDHVDAHRSTCYVISPWMKKGSVDHAFQNTVSAIRTIECLLDLPPMCQYDAASDVIGNWDDAPRNDAPFTAILPKPELMRDRNPLIKGIVPISPEQPKEKAPAKKPKAKAEAEPGANRELKTVEDLAQASAEMDFTHADKAPADLLNRVMWKSVKGVDSEMPETPHVIGLAGQKKDDDDD